MTSEVPGPGHMLYANASDYDYDNPPPAKPNLQNWNGNSDATDNRHGVGENYDSPPPPAKKSIGGNGQTGGSGTVSADTNAFLVTAANVKALIDPVKNATTRLNTVNTKPGAFSQAFALKKQVDGGLTDGVLAANAKLIETLTDVGAGLEKMAMDYETTEDANNAKAEDLQKHMPDLAGDINAIFGMKN